MFVVVLTIHCRLLRAFSDAFSDFIYDAHSTLFWAGKTYTPKLRVPSLSSEGDVNIQDFLQDCFLNAFDQLVRAVGECEGVIGFEVWIFFCLSLPQKNLMLTSALLNRFYDVANERTSPRLRFNSFFA